MLNRVHHLNCGTMCPYGGRLMHGPGPQHLVCHCLLIETPDAGLVLVDTGFGMGDVRDPGRLSPVFRTANGIRLSPRETALHQVERMGFDRRDVRHIVLTHLDFDHAGGLTDFPWAQVHVLRREHRAARLTRDEMLARQRYRPAQWGSDTRWHLYDGLGDTWFGFEAVRELRGLPPELLMVPLPGHTWGHAGVAVAVGGGWLLHAGDAYFYQGEMDTRRPTCTAGLEAYQKVMEVDRERRLANQHRLRGLVHDHGDEVLVFCAHDPSEFEMLQQLRAGAVERAREPAMA
jgi:glyoxylase-like metal-dependent hydrolase (beta-lactamase superfamily II)